MKNKLFPTILSLFDDRNEDDDAPDISEIVRLTSVKEEKLKQIIAMAQQVELSSLEKSDGRTVVDNLQALVNIFYNRFLPAKQFWKQLLIPLQNGAAKCNNRWRKM